MIKFYSKVVKVEYKKRLKRAWRINDEIKTEEENLGWFMLLEDSWESLYLGDKKPDFEVGDQVEVTIAYRGKL